MFKYGLLEALLLCVFFNISQELLKIGPCVGQDKYGNKYFHNPYYYFAACRWVEYAPHFNWDYDGSQIPAEWYGWLHNKVG